MERQKIRKGILMISFLFLPVTMFYLSPLLIIQGARKGIVTGSLLFIFVLFLFSLFQGRTFCGWVCPAGALQEWAFNVNNKPVRGGKLNWIKYFIWAPWIIFLTLLVTSVGGFTYIDIFYRTRFGVSLADPSAYVLYYGAMGFILGLAFILGKRPFCHYICILAPFMTIGRKISTRTGLPVLCLVAEQDKCVNCGICSRNCPMSIDVRSMVQKDSMYDSECIFCGNCVDSCPKKVISFSRGKSGCCKKKYNKPGNSQSP